MKTSLKLAILAGGALACSGALVPLTSYAADNPSTIELSAKVLPTITLDSASGFTVQGDAGAVMIGTVSTTVTSNTRYTIGFKVADSSTTTDMTSASTSDVIPAGTNVVENNSAWGIKTKTGAGDDQNAANYTAVTKTSQTFYTSSSTANAATVNFKVGISTKKSQTAGSYSVDLTVTASSI